MDSMAPVLLTLSPILCYYYMSSRKLKNKSNGEARAGTLRCLRDIPPAHYTLKIESFSFFLNNQIENFESNAFKAGGYQWKLSLYPKGNKKKNADGYISLYLSIADTETLPLGWEVNVYFKLFVFDHIRDKYLVIQDEGKIRRFHPLKTEWGFDKFLSLDTFNDASNGYLVDDCCVFGAEVFVIEHTRKRECLSKIMNIPVNDTCTWNIHKFSTINEEYLYSEEFVVGDHRWKLVLYPKGDRTSNGKSLSLYLELVDWETLSSGMKLYVECKLRIKDQLHGNHWKGEDVKLCFRRLVNYWGYPDFLSQSALKNASNGFMVNDAVIVEAQITLISSFKDV